MAVLSHADRARIEAAVRAVESRTRCEFVAVLAASSDSSFYARWAVPALVALLVPWVLLPFGWFGTASLLSVQLLTFAVLATALQWPPLARRLVPRTVQKEAAARAARLQFHELGLADTAERIGVMLFVSQTEHYVEILVDRGVAQMIEPDAWQAIIDRFVADVRQSRLADGFERAIAACGEVLARHFPAGDTDRNELPDRLVEL